LIQLSQFSFSHAAPKVTWALFFIRAAGPRIGSKPDTRKASVATLGGLRTSRFTSRWALACPAQVGLAVLSQPPSKPMILEQETAC